MNRMTRVDRATFGRMPGGASVESLTLSNDRGTKVRTIAYGAAIVSIHTADRAGDLGNVVLGFDTLDGYLANTTFVGGVVGRYANRIARGEFVLDGQRYRLPTNNGPHHLHGGTRGFDKVLWSAEPLEQSGETSVTYAYESVDGEEGYPGTLNARVTYALTDENELVVDYEAVADQPTPVNLTQHSYFNLSGGTRDNILGHILTVHADRYTPTDGTLIPTGELATVEGTPFDFRRPTMIGARIGDDHAQLKNAGGYDHNWLVSQSSASLARVARLVDPTSGRTVDVQTTEPGLQFYSGNFLEHKHAGLCLETQHFPDSPNHPQFPPTILRPGERYRSRTVFAFSA
jgi:aldose 1-epimerase